MTSYLSMPRSLLVFCAVVLILGAAVAPPCMGCPSGGGCRRCIVRQLKTGCPGCVPIMQCMARCLWGGALRSRCVGKCDCGGGYPRLGDCKKCLAQCKCSCSSS